MRSYLWQKLLCVLLMSCTWGVSAQARVVIIDADTANEVDDPYAIVKAFSVDGWDIVALNAAQWQASQWAVPDTMEQSYRMNQELASYLNIHKNTQVLRGGHRRLFDWGADVAIYSSATHHLIQKARELEPQERITVIVLGALTNIASALLIDPEIAGKLDVYWLGSTFDFSSKRIKFLDFNPLMDPQAVDVLLSSDVQLHILPVSIMGQYQADFSKALSYFAGKGELGDYLIDLWREHKDGGKKQRILWDVALIQAVQFPEKFKTERLAGFANTNVHVYTDMNTQFLLDDLYDSISDHLLELE